MTKKIDKHILVQEMQEKCAKANFIFLINYKSVNAETMFNFRKKLNNECGLKYNIVKNRLIAKAIENSQFQDIKGTLKGQNGIIIADDALKVAKVIDHFCLKNKNFQFIVCCNEGKLHDSEYVAQLAKLKSLPEMRSQLLATLNFVGSSLLRVFNESTTSSFREGNIESEKS